jgi:hypothetical protein
MRIEASLSADGTAIRLIGRLSAECLPLLKAQIEAGGSRVALEMSEVTLVDVEVVRFLVECMARGVQLRACSAYIREWIAREKAGRT